MTDLRDRWVGRVEKCIDDEAIDKLEVQHKSGSFYFYSEDREQFLRSGLCTGNR